MKTIKLSLSTKYCPDWGLWEGCREIIQNAKDAETEHKAIMNVSHDAENNILIVINAGCTIPHSALLIGESTKQDKNLIGQFGEGMKIGILALLRSGHEVTIYNGQELWKPRLVVDEIFNQPVLAVDITDALQPLDNVTVHISNITAEDFQMLQERIRFLSPGPWPKIIPELPGQIYSNGIFVCKLDDFKYGYDLSLKLDRDRKLANHGEILMAVGSLWMTRLADEPGVHEQAFHDLLSDANAEDLKDVHYTPEIWSQTPRDFYEKFFMPKYGADAFAVSNNVDETTVKAWGGKAVILPYTYAKFIEKVLGTVKAWALKKSQCTEYIYKLEELSAYEQQSLKTALEIIDRADPISAARVQIVDFSRGALRGLHHGKGGMISIGRNQLYSLLALIETLLHEFAHDAGTDGTVEHTTELQARASEVIVKLYARSAK